MSGASGASAHRRAHRQRDDGLTDHCGCCAHRRSTGCGGPTCPCATAREDCRVDPLAEGTAAPNGAYVTPVLDHLTALGGCYRGSWSNFDGRTLRTQLDDVRTLLERALAGENVADAVQRDREMHGMCPFGGSHWGEFCHDYGCAATEAT